MTHVGVFDSGVGGLTVLSAILSRLPHLSTAYLGDTARVPYGTRSAQTVVRYALNAAKFLVERESPQALVIACNTASAVAVDAVQELLDIPVIGVVEPTAERALELTENHVIGVAGTRGTVRSGAYQRALAERASDATVVASACPLFVPLAEEGLVAPDDPVVKGIVERYLAPFVEAGADTLILGCTHYPLLADAISAVAPQLRLADAADSVASKLATLVEADTEGEAKRSYYVTDAPEGFLSVAERFLGSPIGAPHEVDL